MATTIDKTFKCFTFLHRKKNMQFCQSKNSKVSSSGSLKPRQNKLFFWKIQELYSIMLVNLKDITYLDRKYYRLKNIYKNVNNFRTNVRLYVK